MAPFFVGPSATVTVAVENVSRLSFRLGCNDDVSWDNGGIFDAAVDLMR